MTQLEAKHQKTLQNVAEDHKANVEKMQSQITSLEKENRVMHDRLEVGAKSMLTEQGGLEKKLERAIDEKERLTKEID